jgi:hypothetical protein
MCKIPVPSRVIVLGPNTFLNYLNQTTIPGDIESLNQSDYVKILRLVFEPLEGRKNELNRLFVNGVESVSNVEGMSYRRFLPPWRVIVHQLFHGLKDLVFTQSISCKIKHHFSCSACQLYH